MTDERDTSQGPARPESGAPAQDDEPTLETVAPVIEPAAPAQDDEPTPDDDEPTLETVAPGGAVDSTQESAFPGIMSDNTMETVTPKVTGWGSRLEQMTAAKKMRRRHVITRFWWAATPVLILLVIAVVLLAVYGGQGGGDSVPSTSTTVTRQQVEGSGLLLVTKDDALSWAVILEPWDSGGVVMVVPGLTLLESEGAFKTLSGIYTGGHQDLVEATLAEALDMSMGPVAVVDWPALQAAAKQAGVQGLSDQSASTGQGENDPLAAAMRTLVGEYDSADGGPWNDIGLEGDTAEFLRALGVDQASMAKDVWTTGTLAGTMVVGDGFAYMEPDIAAAKSLLAVAVQVTIVSVEVKDGAGIEGAPRRAGGLIESGGFSLAPMSYAEGYPTVEKTQVLASTEALEKARQVQTLLGVGEVVEDQTLTADHIVVVLGKDFSGESD